MDNSCIVCCFHCFIHSDVYDKLIIYQPCLLTDIQVVTGCLVCTNVEFAHLCSAH